MVDNIFNANKSSPFGTKYSLLVDSLKIGVTIQQLNQLNNIGTTRTEKSFESAEVKSVKFHRFCQRLYFKHIVNQRKLITFCCRYVDTCFVYYDRSQQLDITARCYVSDMSCIIYK